MNKIRNFLMLMAVVVAVTGAFAFKANVMPPGDKYSVSGSAAITATNGDGTVDVTVGSTTGVAPANGLVLGEDYSCEEPVVICTFTFTAFTQVITHPDGSVTYTHVIVQTGTFRLI
jgi:hypothetical protein